MSERSKDKDRLQWRKILPPASSARFAQTTNTMYVLDGLKVLCDSGRVEAAYFIAEELLGKQVPVLLGHVDWIPIACRVFDASRLFPYESQGFVIAFLGSSVRSGRNELSCIFYDDVVYYARVCTKNEYDIVWREISK